MELVHKVWISFGLKESITEVEALSGGLINSTFLIYTPTHAYILQKINSSVFPEPEIVIQNLEVIGKTLDKASFPYQYPKYVHSPSGEKFCRAEGGYWRLTHYIPSTRSISYVNNISQAYLMGKAMGRLSHDLSTLSEGSLREPIPGFMNFRGRLNKLQEAIKKDAAGRYTEVKTWVQQILSDSTFLDEIIETLSNCPKRIIHGDPKVGNVLWDEGLENIIGVIDFDTAMAGPILYDFSDMVRSITSELKEDIPPNGRAIFSPEKFQSLYEGYMEEVSHIVTPKEKESLDKGYPLVTYIQVLRFLTDYLDGDTYYKTEYARHNLDRTRNQWALFKEMRMQQKR